MICTRCGHLADRSDRNCPECGLQLRAHDLPLDLSGTGVEHSDPRLLAALGIFLVVGVVATVAVWFFTRGLVNDFDRGVQRLATASSPTPTVNPKLPQAAPRTASPTPSATGLPHAAALPSAAKECSATVGASSTTSCGLALAVAKELPPAPGGSFQVKATSPTSGSSYQLSCTAARMVVCSGGSNISVYVLY